MRHHHEGATVFGAEAVDTERRAVGVQRVAFGVFVLAVHIAQRHETGLEAGFSGFAASEFRAAFAVCDRDREHGACHALEEHGRSIFDLERAEAGLETFGEVLHKARPVRSTRNQVLEVGNHLAAVADAEREGVLAVEVSFEFGAGLRVEEDALGPAFTGTENVTVAEATASDETIEVLEAYATFENVGHVNVDRFKACLLEGCSHFEFAVDALFTQDGHLRAAGVVFHDLCTRRHVEGDLRRDTRIVLFQLEIVFAFGTIRVIAESRDAAGRVAPDGAKIREAFGGL